MNDGRWKQILRILFVNALILIAALGVSELLYSSYSYLYPSQQKSIWLFEDSGKTLQFDPIRGYVVTQVPSRSARITKGVVEYIGTFRGNEQGFPDRDNFQPQRTSPKIKRFAVFGDSFSSAQFLAVNWPDRAEDLIRREGGRIELLNFSVDGGGLANWASVIRSLVRQEHYELDGLVFAVCCNDVDRTFAYTDDRNRAKHAMAYTPSWDPETYPKTLDPSTMRALEQSEKGPSFIVTSDEFNEVLKGKRLIESHPWRFELLWQLRSIYWGYAARRELAKTQESTDLVDGQLHLIEEIREFAEFQNLPILVVYIGGRDDSISRDEHFFIRKTRRFADALGAEFLDGRTAFEGMTHAQLQTIWLPYDGHWGQGASDVFAGYMAKKLAPRLDRENPTASSAR